MRAVLLNVVGMFAVAMWDAVECWLLVDLVAIVAEVPVALVLLLIVLST